MKDTIITSKDLKWLYSKLETTEEVEEVSEYMRANKLVITLRDCHDSQSGWNGQNVILEGKDLSGNGYCFNGKALLNHVRHHRNHLELSKTAEYKTFLELSKKYFDTWRYLNN